MKTSQIENPLTFVTDPDPDKSHAANNARILRETATAILAALTVEDSSEGYDKSKGLTLEEWRKQYWQTMAATAVDAAQALLAELERRTEQPR